MFVFAAVLEATALQTSVPTSLHDLRRRGHSPHAAGVLLQQRSSPERLGLIDVDGDQRATPIQLLFCRVNNFRRKGVGEVRPLVENLHPERFGGVVLDQELERQLGCVAVVECRHQRLNEHAGLLEVRLHLQPGGV